MNRRARTVFRAIGITSLALISLLTADPSSAEIKTITATGEYRMGDNDTRTDAKRLALLDAKRLALEQAGTYLESVTEIKNLSVARDELNAYTAGIVEVTELSSKDVLEGVTHVIRVEVTAKIDTDVVARQIEMLHQSETAKAELQRLATERDRLKQEVDAKTRELAALKSRSAVETVSVQRRKILTKLDVFELLKRSSAALRRVQSIRIELIRVADIPDDILKQLQKLEQLDKEDLAVQVELRKQRRAFLETQLREAMREARELADQALLLDPSEHMAHAAKGSVLLEEGNAKAAVEEYRIALRLSSDVAPLRAMAHFQLATALKALGEVAGAIEEFRIAVGIAPEEAVSHMSLGEALQDSGDLKGAVGAFRTVTKLKPDWATAHLKLGQALEQSGNLREAIKEYRIITRLEPDQKLWHDLIVDALAKMGDIDGAIIEMRSGHPGSKDYLLAMLLAGRLQKAGDRSGAVAATRLAVRINPDEPGTHSILAWALDRSGDLPGAIREYRAALRLKPGKTYGGAKVHARLAIALTAAGDHDGAIREARTALRLEPVEGLAHFALGKAFLAKGQTKAAAEEFKEFLRLAHDTPDDDDRELIQNAQAWLRDLE